MAKAVGCEWEYRTVYHFGSDQVHASMASVAARLAAPQGDPARTLVAILLPFNKLLGLANDFLDLGVGDRLAPLSDRTGSFLRAHLAEVSGRITPE